MKTLSGMLLAACATIAAPAAAQSIPSTEYVKSAGASDLYERQSSQLVLQSTANPQVRSFAQMMITQHQKSTADVKAAAARSKVKAPPPKLTPAQAEMIAQLRAQSGTARDTAYTAQQRTAHDQALSLHQSYAASGTAAPLRAAAGKIVPVVQHHIEMLAKM